jgi:hypothetical protein
MVSAWYAFVCFLVYVLCFFAEWIFEGDTLLFLIGIALRITHQSTWFERKWMRTCWGFVDFINFVNDCHATTLALRLRELVYVKGPKASIKKLVGSII